MPLETTFPTATGIKTKPLGQILAERLKNTWDPNKTISTPKIQASKIYFEWSNQNLTDASVPDNRFIVVRVHSGRRRFTDLEIGVNTIQAIQSPTVHVYCDDMRATDRGEGSPIAADMAQYIVNFFADNVSGFQDEGIHTIEMGEDNWIPNNDSPNWHHWALQLTASYELRRT